MSDTPRTDAIRTKACLNWDNTGDYVKEIVPADFARQLERENTALRNAQKICDDCDAPTMEQFKKLESEVHQHQLCDEEILKWKAMAQANQTLAIAIARYTSHREGCSRGENNICTCGLLELLKQIKP